MLRLGLPQDASASQEFWGQEGLQSAFVGHGSGIPPLATLYKRGNVWYLNWREHGQQWRKSLGQIEAREAENRRAEKEAELRGLITITRGVTVGSILSDYLTWYKDARQSTYKRALSALKPFRAEFDGMSAESLPPTLIERWATRQTATGQAEKALKLARAAFRRAVKQRTIAHSPMDGVTIQKPLTSRAPDYYRPEQLRKLSGAPHAAIWSFMVNTGIRRSEMAKALPSDVRNRILYVESAPSGRTKNARWRAIPLNKDALRALKALGKKKLVNCHPDTLGDWFSAEAKDLKLPGSLHWLRHTFCTALAQSGRSLHEIKQLAGHSSITVTEQYAHHAPGFGKAAVDSMAGWMKAQNKHTKR